MGKTLGKIIQIGSFVALAAVTVVGGVALVGGASLGEAIAAGVSSVGILSGAGSAIVGGLALLGASNVLGGIFTPGIATAQLPKPDTTSTALKTPFPPRIRAYGSSRLYGAYTLFTTSQHGVALDAYAFIFTGGIPIDGVEKLYLGDKLVGTAAGVVAGLDDGTYSGGLVEIDFRLGHATETAFSQITTLIPDEWDGSHRGDGCVTGMVTWKPAKAEDYNKIYPNGQPPLSLVARWLKVYDWRDPSQSLTDPSTWKWTENAILHLSDYLLVVEKAERLPTEMFPSGTALQAAWDTYFAPTLAYWTAAANDADSGVPLKAGGTEPRYRSCLSHKLTDAHKDTKARLLACCDGWLAPREDRALVIYSGRYYTPTVSLGPDEIVSFSLQDGIEDENAINDIAITYLSAEHDYTTVDADNWQDIDDIESRGGLRSDTLADDVPSYTQARRLAKRKLSQAMAHRRGTITTNGGGRAARGQRFVHVDLVESGVTFFSGPIEITAMTRNLQTGGVTLTWIEADPNIDAWNPDTEEGNPAPVGDGVASLPLTAPTITAATAGIYPNAGVRIQITGTGPDRSDLVWFARWRKQGDEVWNEQTYNDVDPGPDAELITSFVPADTTVEVEIAYKVGDGRVSPWSSPPADVDTASDALQLIPGGDWDSGTAYPKGAVVNYEGTSYFAIRDVPAGTSVADTSYWQTLAAAGSNGLSIAIAPGAMSIPCDSDGTPKSGALPETAQIIFYDGTIDIHASATYSIVTSNCTATIDADGLLTVTALSADKASVLVTASYGTRSMQQGYSISKARDGATGMPGTTAYAITLIDMGTTAYGGSILLADGDTITLHAEAVVYASGGSPAMTLTAQYAANGGSFANMGGSYTDSTTIALHDTETLIVNGTYTNSSGAQQTVTFQTILTNVGGTPVVQGGSFMQPRT